jgi:2-polyprenyl-6-methoxyphenol hydroxylase-like FAD-dependent oxidoreductase
MLARILTISNIPVTVFEGDTSPNYRSQGGTLDLHPKTGLAAVKAGNLFDEFKKLGRYDGDYYLMTDKDCKPFIEFGPSKGGFNQRPEIDRADLRKMLTESLPEGVIKWGHHLKGVEDGGKLVFEHGVESGFDLIIGCEGAWSKVRNYVTDVKPTYSGIGYTAFDVLEAKETAPELNTLINGGNVFAFAEGKQLAAQQMGDGSVSVGWASVRPEDWMETCGYDPHNLEAARKAVLEDMPSWSPKLRDAIEKVGGSKCQPRNFYKLPVGWRWEHRRGATIIGDAAHLMTPFAGVGVNLALDDARKLGAAIVKAVQSNKGLDELDRQVEVFEKEMFPRMEKYQRLTNDVTQLWFFSNQGANYVVPDTIMAHVRMDTPAILHPLAGVAVHVLWWMKTAIWG